MKRLVALFSMFLSAAIMVTACSPLAKGIFDETAIEVQTEITKESEASTQSETTTAAPSTETSTVEEKTTEEEYQESITKETEGSVEVPEGETAPDFELSDKTITDTGDNASSQTAQEFVPGDTIQGSIAPEKDEDFFSFNLPMSGQLELDITSHMRYYTIIIYDETGDQIWYSDNNEFNSTVGFREDTHLIDIESGAYYIKITGFKYKDNSYESTGNYEIKTSFVSANASEKENNNSVAEANNVKLGSIITGLIGCNDRYDFYEFILDESGRVKLDITSYMRYYTLIMYDDKGEQLWYSDNNEFNSTVGFKEENYSVDLEAGNYYLKVTGYKYKDDSYESTGKYIINTEFEPAKATEIEENNSADKANSISIGENVTGLIGSNDRFDFYSFSIDKAGKVAIEIMSYMRYYCMFIYDKSGKEIWQTDNNEYNETSGFRSDIHEVDLEAGEYYLKVTGYKYKDNSYESTGTYQFIIRAE